MFDLFFMLASKQVDLNSQLQSSVCSQNWERSIQIVDSMLEVAPDYRSQLIAYRSRLSSLTGAVLPRDLIPNCQGTPSSKWVQTEIPKVGKAEVDLNSRQISATEEGEVNKFIYRSPILANSYR